MLKKLILKLKKVNKYIANFSHAMDKGDANDSRFGKFEINKSYFDKELDIKHEELLFNDKPLPEGKIVSYLIDILKIYQLEDSDIIVIAKYSGGTACPAQLQIIEVSKTDIHVTEEFGSCSDLITFENPTSKKFITMPWFDGEYSYSYQNKKLYKNEPEKEKLLLEQEEVKTDDTPITTEFSNATNTIIELNQRGVFNIWHMTHKDNIKEILNKGLLSNTLAYSQLTPKDISDHGVQKRRESKEPVYGRKLHDYSPTYIKIKNPMLFAKNEMQDELCLIEISIFVLLENNFIFTDGNAASKSTNFYKSCEDLEQLPWEVLDAIYWSDFDDGKRKRCAEILVYPSIDVKHITKIHCNSNKTLSHLKQFNIESQISKELFFDNILVSNQDIHF